MAKDLTKLVSELLAFGKTAAATASDPTEKGSPGTFPEERVIAPLPGPHGEGQLENVPPVSPTEPAGDSKIQVGPGGGSVSVPAATAFNEAASVGSASKAAGLIAGAAALRSKLANFGKEVAVLETEKADSKAKAQAAGGKTEDEGDDKEASYVPGDYLMKIAFHLMQSPEGLSSVNRAMDEILGQEAAQSLVKAAADEQASFLRDYTIGRINQAEAEAQQLKQAAAQRDAQEYYAALTKGASAEELQAIDNSALLINRARAMFADNPIAKLASDIGFEAASKAAAAMEQGAPPEEAAEMAAQEGAGAPAEGPPSPEELEAAISVLVEQGVITPEQAQELIAEIMGGGGMEGGQEMPGGEMPPEMAAKQAAADEALQKIASTIFA